MYFKITLERSFDPAAGEIDVYPQEITRALLNLISNGFYAATKRNQQDHNEGYEPTLTATTENLGDRVEITIRDNGSGITLEVREKMFNPFFTTKSAGEGTVYHSRHHREATFGIYRGLYAARRVHRGPHCLAARGFVHR